MSQKLELTAHVSPRRNNGGGKVKVVTSVTIRLNGKKAVAFRVLGGAYNAKAALKEFRKAHFRFTPEPGETAETLAFYASAA